MASNAELRNCLKQVRIDGELTQAGLAHLVGVSRKTINTVENGVYVPSTVLALKIARVLEVSVEDLFELIEPARPQP